MSATTMFDAAQLQDLHAGLAESLDATQALKERCVMHPFANEGARMHARHGLARRLGTLSRCVERVYDVLPPDLEDLPERDAVHEASTQIQAFVMNAFGACDNLAWLWVLERGVKQANGAQLAPRQVGLGERYTRVRESLTPGLQNLLLQRTDWFKHLTDFRDALAHRIPLYIPPFMIDPDDGAEYEALDQAAAQSLMAGDLLAYEANVANRDALRHFKPLMTHTHQPPAKVIVFHVQLLADLSTVNDLGTRFLDELADE
jgi:hypothetical protein